MMRPAGLNSIVLTSQFALRAAAFLLLAVLLGPSGQGAAAKAQLVAMVGGALVGMGLDTALVIAGARSEMRVLARQTMWTHACVLFVAPLIVLAAVATVTTVSAPVAAGLVALWGLQTGRMAAAFCQGTDNNWLFAAFSVVPSGVYLAIIVCAELFGNLSVSAAVWSFAIAMNAPMLLMCIVSWGEIAPTSIRLSFRNSVYAVGARIYPGGVASLANLRLDQVLIAAFLPSSALGYYTLAVTITESSTLSAQGAATTTLRAASRGEASLADVHRLGKLLAPLPLATLPAMLLLTETMLPDYRKSIVPLVCLVPGAIALSLTKLYAAWITGSGGAWVCSRIAILTTVVTVGATTAGVFAFGIAGAALASSLAYVVACALTQRAAPDFSAPSASPPKVPAVAIP
jgi:O-antigen/teichoic acid export membrane protein